MFRRLPKSLPADATVIPDLEKLGYFINDSDQIRQIRNPEESYQFRVNRNDRVNEIYKEAMNTCIRKIVHERLRDKGLDELRIPIGTPAHQNHLPILVSKDIATKSRVIVLFGDRKHDLGILSYRVMGEEGINNGSVVGLVEAMTSESTPEDPGIIIANPSQLIWYRGGGRAVTDREWLALPRESAVHDAMRIDETKNHVPHNRNHIEHVQYLFEHVIRGICDKDARFNIIGLEYTGSAVMNYLAGNWDNWNGRISSIALVNPQHSLAELVEGEPKSSTMVGFIRQKTRAYFLSEERVNTLMSGSERLGCNCYSSGETLYEESVFVRCWMSILSWFCEVEAHPNYSEPIFEVTKWSGTDEDEG